jgi:hypothetical protein
VTVSTTNTRHVYSSDGVTKEWPYTFKILEPSDIELWITNAYGVSTQIETGFTVDTVNSRVIYPTTGSPLSDDGTLITLVRILPMTQGATFTTTGPFSPTVIETALDRLTLMIQQLQDQIRHSPLAAPSPLPVYVAGTVYIDDIVVGVPGEGIVLTTPDDIYVYRLAVSNSMEVTRERIDGSYADELINVNPGRGIVFTAPDGLKRFRVAVNSIGEITRQQVGPYTFDIAITAPGKGLVCTTPDGLHMVRIAIDNDGEVTKEEIT